MVSNTIGNTLGWKGVGNAQDVINGVEKFCFFSSFFMRRGDNVEDHLIKEVWVRNNSTTLRR